MKLSRVSAIPIVGMCLGAVLALAQAQRASTPAAGAAPPSAAGAVAAHSDDEYLAHVARIAKALPNFTVLVQKPFVIAGDDTPENVRAAGVQTVKWTVDHLKKDFFDKDPVDLIDIYLFKNKTSYDKYTKEYFNDPVISPYGY